MRASAAADAANDKCKQFNLELKSMSDKNKIIESTLSKEQERLQVEREASKRYVEALQKITTALQEQLGSALFSIDEDVESQSSAMLSALRSYFSEMQVEKQRLTSSNDALASQLQATSANRRTQISCCGAEKTTVAQGQMQRLKLTKLNDVCAAHRKNRAVSTVRALPRTTMAIGHGAIDKIMKSSVDSTQSIEASANVPRHEIIDAIVEDIRTRMQQRDSEVIQSTVSFPTCESVAAIVSAA
jgi:hypothetical protein